VTQVNGLDHLSSCRRRIAPVSAAWTALRCRSSDVATVRW